MYEVNLNFSKNYERLKIQYIRKHPELMGKLQNKDIANDCFMSESHISNLINGKTELTTEDIKTLAKFFEVTPFEIITGCPPQNVDIHIQTGLSNESILWLRAHNSRKNEKYKYRTEILNQILEDKDIARSFFDVLYEFVCGVRETDESKLHNFKNFEDYIEYTKMVALFKLGKVLDNFYEINKKED